VRGGRFSTGEIVFREGCGGKFPGELVRKKPPFMGWKTKDIRLGKSSPLHTGGDSFLNLSAKEGSKNQSVKGGLLELNIPVGEC